VTVPQFPDGIYKSHPQPINPFPSFSFYWRMAEIVIRASIKARWRHYDYEDWRSSSWEIVKALEKVGCQLDIRGLDHLAAVDGPCVIIGNHMSTLETFVLPSLLVPYRKSTFVVKQSLIDYPVFKHVMVSRNPVVVGRSNPREDLKIVLEEGCKRLADGISLVVFPQTTRTTCFDPEQFNSIGIKLAKRAQVPVIPLALRSDAWGNGQRIKDFGVINPTSQIHFEFAPPLEINGNGQQEHQAIMSFIQSRLKDWGL